MTAWLVHTLIATSLLMLLVLAIRLPVARLFGARVAYALWLIPALRLLLPVLPERAAVPSFAAETGIQAATVPAAVAAATELSIVPYLVAIWLIGAGLFLAIHLAAHWRFVSRAMVAGQRLAIGSDGEVIESEAVASPMAAGLLVPRIFLPVGLRQRIGNDQFELALAHERLHHRRGDLFALAAALIVLALNWFNPIAHFAHRAFRSDLEAACDAELAETLGPIERETYARAIIGCAAAPVPHAICTLTSIDDLKRRLTMLNSTHGRNARLAGAFFAAVFAAGGLAATAQAQAAPEAAGKPGGNRVEVRLFKDANGKVIGEADENVKVMIEKCEGEKFESDRPSADGKEKTKVILCMKKGSSPSETAAVLEKSLERIEAAGGLGTESKAEVIAKLRERIAELRAR